MLLRTRRLPFLRDDSGSVLIPVIAVMAVGLIVGAMLSTSMVGGLTFSSTTRSGVQSQAAADAGVAAARAGISNSTCVLQSTPGTYSSTGSPYYSAIVQQSVNGTWSAGCPVYPSPQVRVLSTGRALDSGGNPTGASSTVEAIYNLAWPQTITPTGVGMYLYAGGQLEANGGLDLNNNDGGGLVIKTGSLDCLKNGSVINANAIVNGNLNFGTSTCSLNGNASVAGLTTLGNGKPSITGDLFTATGGSVSPTNPTKTQVAGTYTYGGTMPGTAPWSEVGYDRDAWKYSGATPYQYEELSGDSCNQSNGIVPGGSFGGLSGTPTIINALACPAGIQVTNNTTFQLTSDVVIYANMFTWGTTTTSVNSLTFNSSDSSSHKLWFITPDSNLDDNQPTCGADQGPFYAKNGFTIGANISAMLYTPCEFDGKNGFTWTGQIYAGSYSYVDNNSSFTYQGVGIAGHDLNTGTVTTPPTTVQLSGVSVRNYKS